MAENLSRHFSEEDIYIYVRPISSIAKSQCDTTSYAKRWMIVSVGKNTDNQDTPTAAGNVNCSTTL